MREEREIVVYADIEEQLQAALPSLDGVTLTPYTVWFTNTAGEVAIGLRVESPSGDPR